MRIGYMMDSRLGKASVDARVQEVVAAERAGFESYWFDSGGHDPLTLAALAGRETRRIELATGIAITYPRHPFFTAQQALTVQGACGGRFTLGVGVSGRAMVEDGLGLSYAHPAAHTAEYLSVLRSLLAEGRADFDGRFYKVHIEHSVPEPRPVPVVIAALGPRMLRVAAELTDGAITWLAGIKTVETHVVPTLKEAAEAAGRATSPRLAVNLPVVVTDGAAAALEGVARCYAHYRRIPHYARLFEIEGVDGPAGVALVGNEALVEKQLRAFAAAGATDFVACIPPMVAGETPSTTRTWKALSELVGKV